MFDAAFQQRCENLQRAARSKWGSRLLGRPLEKRLAGGTEATDQTDYTSGDDLRYVDWFRCARLDELLTNRFEGKEDNSVYVLLDCSASMRGDGGAKFDFARRLAATLAYLAIANHDRLGVMCFDETTVSEFPTVRGRQHLPALFQYFENAQITTTVTNLQRAVEAFARRDQQRGVAVVISDFYDAAGFEKAVDVLRRQHYYPFLFQVEDPRDIEPDWLGNVRLADAESSWSAAATLEAADLMNYRRVYEAFRQQLLTYCARYKIGLVHARSDEVVESCLERMMRTAVAQLTAI